MAWHGMAWHGMAWHGIAQLRLTDNFVVFVLCILCQPCLATGKKQCDAEALGLHSWACDTPQLIQLVAAEAA